MDWFREHWFLRGVQSAIFYYVSCAPCTKYTSHKKRQKQLARDRKKRHAEESDVELYSHYARQPSPYKINPYWEEERKEGPGPPPKKVSNKEREKRRQARGRERTRAGVETGKGGRIEGDARPTPLLGGGDGTTREGVKERLKSALPDRRSWLGGRFQREDEELWTGDMSISPSAESFRTHNPHEPSSSSDNHRPRAQHRTASLGGIPILGMASIERGAARIKNSTETFFTARNPPINDLHPPVVSNPAVNAIGNRWMLQPPPSAAVMGGFESGVNRRDHNTAIFRRQGNSPKQPNHAHRQKAIDQHLHHRADALPANSPERARIKRLQRLEHNIDRDVRASEQETKMPTAAAPHLNHPVALPSDAEARAIHHSNVHATNLTTPEAASSLPFLYTASAQALLGSTPDSGVDVSLTATMTCEAQNQQPLTDSMDGAVVAKRFEPTTLPEFGSTLYKTRSKTSHDIHLQVLPPLEQNTEKTSELYAENRIWQPAQHNFPVQAQPNNRTSKQSHRHIHNSQPNRRPLANTQSRHRPAADDDSASFSGDDYELEAVADDDDDEGDEGIDPLQKPPLRNPRLPRNIGRQGDTVTGASEGVLMRDLDRARGRAFAVLSGQRQNAYEEVEDEEEEEEEWEDDSGTDGDDDDGNESMQGRRYTREQRGEATWVRKRMRWRGDFGGDGIIRRTYVGERNRRWSVDF